ncbi:poly [ADP-ribose] polymerase 14-like isoform X2 [Mizuhopecten yessoensis]|nr:poly [ADP-ribose] polymerase 14-like isoform X2 [Mizuhopecten yessoensis]
MGHKKFATEVYQRVKKIKREIAVELDRKKKQVKETTSPIKHHQVVMLSLTHFTDTMEKKYPGMKVMLDFKARTVTYDGLYGEVTSAKLEMYEMIHAMVSSDVGDFNKGRYAYLQDMAVKQYVAGKMKEDKIMSIWKMQDNRFVVYAMTDDAAVRAAHILRDSVLETIVDVKKESSSLLSSDSWASEEQSIKDSYGVMVQMKVMMDTPCIVIYSTDRDAGMVRKRVTDFLIMNTIYNTKLSISTGMLRFVIVHCLKEVTAIGDQYNVTIDIDNLGIEIIGTEVGLSKAKMGIGNVIDSVEKKEHILKKPGITKLMTSEDSKLKVSQVEKSHGVVIVPSDESEDDVSGGEAGGRPTPAPRRRDGIQEMARCSQPNYHLMVMLGDITNLKVDVLVNAANKKLQHAGGLAKAIVDKGGKSIQRDCDEHIKRYSRLMEGDVYLGKPGNLKCNFIAHAVGPVWQGGRNNEEEMLREAGLKSMEEANDHNQTSIALPDLGAGVYGYPANKSTRTIVEAVDDFYRDNPGCCIRDVYLCDVSQKTVDLFITAVQNRFGTGNVIVSGHGGGARDKWSAPQAKPRKGWNQAVQGAGRNPTPGNTSSFAVMIYGK